MFIVGSNFPKMEHPLSHERWRLSRWPSLLAIRRNSSHVQFNSMRDRWCECSIMSISDYTSRHQLPLENCTKRELGTTKDVKQYVNFMVTSDIPCAISKDELVKATENDKELQKLFTCIRKKEIDHRDPDMKDT